MDVYSCVGGKLGVFKGIVDQGWTIRNEDITNLVVSCFDALGP